MFSVYLLVSKTNILTTMISVYILVHQNKYLTLFSVIFWFTQTNLFWQIICFDEVCSTDRHGLVGERAVVPPPNQARQWSTLALVCVMPAQTFMSNVNGSINELNPHQ